MVKYATLFCLVITSLPAFADKTANESQWIQTKDNYYSYFANSNDRPSIQATLSLHVRSGTETSPQVRTSQFQFIYQNKQFCKDYQGGQTKAYFVNHQSVKFNVYCYKKEWLNFFPVTEAGNNYIVAAFRKSKESVTFVAQDNNHYTSFKFPTKNFETAYYAIDKATKAPL